MSALSIDTVNAPEPVKASLRTLSATIAFEKQAAKGANGYLFFGRHKVLKRPVAVKYYVWGGDSAYHAEPAALAALQSPHIVPVYTASLLDQKYAYFVTPHYKRGDLDDFMSQGTHGNIAAVDMAASILNGLSTLHGSRYLHRDLKPENIFVTDTGNPCIGDFGSIRHLPTGVGAVPGSGHSLIYSPPESISTGQFARAGDIYQVGIVLYQLLGGPIPYDEMAWLDDGQRVAYLAEPDSIERNIYATRAIQTRIQAGRIVDTSLLPPWVCPPLRKTVAKACHIDPSKRFKTASAFMAHLHRLRKQVHDWRVENGYPTLAGGTSFRIRTDDAGPLRFVEKRKGRGWRADKRFTGESLEEMVSQIEHAAGGR